jgi:hypothetical protein
VVINNTAQLVTTNPTVAGWLNYQQNLEKNERFIIIKY